MEMRDVLRWNTRASAVYALGIWSLFGSFFYLRYTGRFPDKPVKEEEVKEEEESENRRVIQTAHSKTVIVYKKDFVPYTTRVYNFLQSLTDGSGTGSGGPGSEPGAGSGSGPGPGPGPGPGIVSGPGTGAGSSGP